MEHSRAFAPFAVSYNYAQSLAKPCVFPGYTDMMQLPWINTPLFSKMPISRVILIRPMLPRPPLPMSPPFWARGGHLQTLAGHFLPSPTPDLPWERLKLKLPDGDALVLRMLRGQSPRVIYLFHGLGGSANADYVRRTAALFHAQGDSVLALNHRGAGEGRLQAVHPYHMGASLDLAAALQIGRGFFPEGLHIAIGFSLSATMLLLLLGRDRHLAQPDRALAIHPAVEPERISHRLSRGFNRLYDLRFVHRLRRIVRERQDFGLLREAIRIPLGATLRDFDELYTARAAGFRDREDYYERCRVVPHLRNIKTPTMILSALDDPFASGQDLEGVELSPSVHLHLETTGGHMGYISHGLPSRRWLDHALEHYVQALADTPTVLIDDPDAASQSVTGFLALATEAM